MSNNDPFRFNELLANMNPEKMAEQWQEMLQNSPLSKMDFNTIAEFQRKNAEALIKANQAAVKGAQTVFEQQSRMIQDAVSEAAKKMSAQSPDSENLSDENAEFIEQAMKKSMSNFAEIVDTMQDTYSEMSDLIEKRMNENLDELKVNLSKLKS